MFLIGTSNHILLNNACLAAVLSALLHSLPFVWPDQWYFLVFFSYVPLFLAKECTFWNGFFWGIIFYSIFFLPMVYALASYAPQQRWFLYVLFLAYAACICGIFFFFARHVSYFAALFCMLLFNDYCFFIGLGIFCGNRLANPLIPCMAGPSWLLKCCAYQQEIFFLVILAVNTLYAALLRWSTFHGALIFVLLLLVKIHHPTIPLREYQHSPYGALSWQGPDMPLWEKNVLLAEAAEHLCKNNPTISLLFLPESILKGVFNNNVQLARIWQQYVGTKIVFLGSYRSANNRLYNSVYVIKKGKIVSCFDKKNLFFGIEHIPKGWHPLSCIKKNDEFCIGKQRRIPLYNNDYMPYLCSEFFFCHQFEQKAEHLIVLVNDNWFLTETIPRLMLLYARLQALIFQQKIIYCSYYYAYHIAQNGTLKTLPRNSACAHPPI